MSTRDLTKRPPPPAAIVNVARSVEDMLRLCPEFRKRYPYLIEAATVGCLRTVAPTILEKSVAVCKTIDIEIDEHLIREESLVKVFIIGKIAEQLMTTKETNNQLNQDITRQAAESMWEQIHECIKSAEEVRTRIQWALREDVIGTSPMLYNQFYKSIMVPGKAAPKEEHVDLRKRRQPKKTKVDMEETMPVKEAFITTKSEVMKLVRHKCPIYDFWSTDTIDLSMTAQLTVLLLDSEKAKQVDEQPGVRAMTQNHLNHKTHLWVPMPTDVPDEDRGWIAEYEMRIWFPYPSDYMPSVVSRLFRKLAFWR